MLVSLLALVMSQSAAAAELCDPTATGAFGSAHYCTQNGVTTCTLVLDVPTIGIIQTIVTVDNESECNCFVDPSACSSLDPRGNSIDPVRAEKVSASEGPGTTDLLDIQACLFDLETAELKIVELETEQSVSELSAADSEFALSE